AGGHRAQRRRRPARLGDRAPCLALRAAADPFRHGEAALRAAEPGAFPRLAHRLGHPGNLASGTDETAGAMAVRCCGTRVCPVDRGGCGQRRSTPLKIYGIRPVPRHAAPTTPTTPTGQPVALVVRTGDGVLTSPSGVATGTSSVTLPALAKVNVIITAWPETSSRVSPVSSAVAAP